MIRESSQKKNNQKVKKILMNKNLPYFDARTKYWPKTQHTQIFVAFFIENKKKSSQNFQQMRLIRDKKKIFSNFFYSHTQKKGCSKSIES